MRRCGENQFDNIILLPPQLARLLENAALLTALSKKPSSI